jgi:hypothetical protein
MNREALFRRASDCYAKAGRSAMPDAARTRLASGDVVGAARLWEQAGAPSQAARLFSRREQWADAARCFEAANELIPAADCLVRDGRPFQGAWLYARGGRPRAEIELTMAGASGETGHQRLFGEAALALAEGRETPRLSARRLRKIMQALCDLQSRAERREIVPLFVQAAEVISRPDLIAEMFALVGAVDNDPNGVDWRAWVLGRAGADRPTDREQQAGLAKQ